MKKEELQILKEMNELLRNHGPIISKYLNLVEKLQSIENPIKPIKASLTIAELLHEFDVNEDEDSYQYIFSALEIVLKNKSAKFLTEIYAEVATEMECPSGYVKMKIRNFIRKTYTKEKVDFYPRSKKYIDFRGARNLSNAEFFKMVLEYIRDNSITIINEKNKTIIKNK